MKLLLDQGLPVSAVEELRRRGVDAVHASAIGLARATDAAILDVAEREERVVITLDADFHAIIATTARARPSVVRIRVEGLRGAALAALVVRVLDECASDLEAGAIATCDGERVRVRLLPLT